MLKKLKKEISIVFTQTDFETTPSAEAFPKQIFINISRMF